LKYIVDTTTIKAFDSNIIIPFKDIYPYKPLLIPLTYLDPLGYTIYYPYYYSLPTL